MIDIKEYAPKIEKVQETKPKKKRRLLEKDTVLMDEDGFGFESS